MTVLSQNFVKKGGRTFNHKLIFVISDRMGTKNFVSLYVGVPVAGKMDLSSGNPFLRGLSILADLKCLRFRTNWSWFIIDFFTNCILVFKFLQKISHFIR